MGSASGLNKVRTRLRWYSRMKCQSTGISAANIAAAPSMNHQDRPAKNKTAAPELATNNDVPKSGCLAINITGTANNRPAAGTCLGLGGKGCSDKYQAIIMGAAILVNSEG